MTAIRATTGRGHRLTPDQVRNRAITERDFQRQVTELAELLGWHWVHFRPAQTSRGWRTPVSGPLGEGWPDLVLVRGSRIIFAELKTEKGALTEAQQRVAAVLDVSLWRPSDFDRIVEVLR